MVQADVQYAVVAFPSNAGSVQVAVDGQNHPLTADSQVPNLFKGSAPSGSSYQYVMDNQAETPKRSLANGASSTGNEFFNRTHTIVNVPELPQAYHPFYPPLFTGMNKSNEVATIILNVNGSAFDSVVQAPTQKGKAQVYSFAYVSNKEVYTISTSGQSTKDFAKQSYAIDFGDFIPQGQKKPLFFGRTIVKLRAEATDPTQLREKLYLDCLAAAGATTLSGSFVRLFVNNQPYGLYTLMDDISTHTIDNMLHGGNWTYATTGVTYKGNALSPTQEGNLAYLGDDPTKYSPDTYKLVDVGEDPNASTKNNTVTNLIDFTKRLSQINPSTITDGNNQALLGLLNPDNTLVALAMNYLTDSWDGLWVQASNYYLNQDFGTNQWCITSYDFDETFGNGAQPGRDSVPYTNYSRPDSVRPLPDLFLNSPYYKLHFEEILKTMVKRFFNTRVIVPRLQAWATLLEEDIAWDYSIPGHSPGTKNTFTVQDFLTNLNSTAASTEGIGQWIGNRVSSLTQQLSFTDADDLPPLGPYKGGNVLLGNGQIVPNDGSNSANPGTSTNGNGSNGTSAASLTIANPVVLASALIVMAMALF
ncbi:hypothetical protein DM01DRAFT_1364539 [Hesseltinella vesiculosa]|uniref:Coth-domain-containing protein n=1 Tax=Hesseltinella vesiculosa TaxID=101127 RepID=A0A1X2G5Z7_9FUNG|nr:hypothetical protein DM01DRAFT_1364539 [Hesseltinella vesiculosa]